MIVDSSEPLQHQSVEDARREEFGQRSPLPRAAVADVSDLTIDGALPIRLYRPESVDPLPALVFLHGGGWALGSLDTVDTLCRALANDASCAIVSVAYRLAPEHPFPAGLEDCYAATAWVAAHARELALDPARIAVGGTSAGANLAVGVTHLARDRGVPGIVFQLLVYPPTDYHARADVAGSPFTRADIGWYWSQYLADPSNGDDPGASPLRASDFSRLPPALVITAELDPLTDEAERYARRVADTGVPVEISRFTGVLHGFFSSATPEGEAARKQAAAALSRAFAA